MRHAIKACLVLAAIPVAYSPAAQNPDQPVATTGDGGQAVTTASLRQAFKKVALLYKGKKYKQSALAAGEAGELLSRLAATGTASAGDLAHFEKKLAAATQLLRLRGLDLSGKPLPSSNISFVNDVAPILVARCANCHIRNSRGGFSMATFADLKKGSEAGIVFKPGISQGSRLVEVIENGDMPRGGGRVTPDELAKIVAWIDGGAEFNGDENTPLITLAPRTRSPEGPTLGVVQATGSESVQFVRDLSPVLVSTCIECHGAMQPAAQLNLSTFATLLRGGRSGAIIAPGKPSDSLLIQKLRGMAGARMPLQRPALEEAVIASFESWIASGAAFDGADPAQSLERAVRVMVANRMSHDELSAMRADLAGKNWNLAIPDATPERREGDGFLLLGNLSPAAMDELARLAKVQQAKVAAQLKVEPGKPFLKGRLTLFAFSRRFDYSEFGTMVEKRDLPSDWTGHWYYDAVDAYGCLVAPSPDDKQADRTVSLMLAQQFAGSYLESQAQAPRWFTVGAARVVASRLHPTSRIVHQWQEAARQALAAGRSPSLFLESGNIVTGDAAAMSFLFLKALMSKPAKFAALLKDLHASMPLEAALEKHYSAGSVALADAWSKSLPRTY